MPLFLPSVVDVVPLLLARVVDLVALLLTSVLDLSPLLLPCLADVLPFLLTDLADLLTFLLAGALLCETGLRRQRRESEKNDPSGKPFHSGTPSELIPFRSPH